MMGMINSISVALVLLSSGSPYVPGDYLLNDNRFLSALAWPFSNSPYHFGALSKVSLTELSTAFLVLLILAGLLIFISNRLFIKRLRKIRKGVDRIYRGEWGAAVEIKGVGELGRLANDFNKMSKKLKEWKIERLSYQNNLKQDNWFHGLLSQMILNLQSCFVREELYALMASSLGQIFPEDSGAFFLETAPDQIEPVAVWGPAPQAKALSLHKCMALWEWQVHCGPVCNHRFSCLQGTSNAQVHICVPTGAQSGVTGLLRVLANPDGPQIDTKKRWATIVAEHMGLHLANVKMNEDLRNLTLRDPLTGLFNRRFMEEALKLEISRAARQRKTLGVIMIDLDHFKRFNDTYGHLAGDAILKELALLLQRNIRSSDIACRYGGEEFTLILAEANKENVIKRAEKLRAAARNLQVWQVYQWLRGLTFSAGVAIYPDHGSTAAVLLEAADLALYRAKATGRNRICVAGEDPDWEKVLSSGPPKEDGAGGNKEGLPGSLPRIKKSYFFRTTQWDWVALKPNPAKSLKIQRGQGNT